LDQLRGAGNPSQVPIFVLGMPRSGTTLTEQIIASHPDVYGAGELSDLMDIVQLPANGQTVQPYPENLSVYPSKTCQILPSNTFQEFAAARLQQNTSRIKMPANYMAMGLIPLMLPHAKIIHVKRNPVDTCLSCYTRLFNRHQDATYDLAELGRHYVGYERLMQHWRKVMPVGSFVEVQYEDIVADMEGQARRLIDYCELEWNDACLEFHKNKRSVRTASLTQVRQPIYNSSVERWRHYEKFLGPLLSALGDLAAAMKNLWLIVLLSLSACTHIRPSKNAVKMPLHWLTKLLEKEYIERIVSPWLLFCPTSIPTAELLTIYIEGDGLSWIDASTPSNEPTPMDPLALKLALRDDAPSAYLARPCQYVAEDRKKSCAQKYWTYSRFSEEVIERAIWL